VLLLITITLVAQAAVNAISITSATALDARRSSALARGLAATPDQVSAGLSAAQVLPALDGAIVGVPVGMALAEALDDDPVTIPALWPLLAVVLGGARHRGPHRHTGPHQRPPWRRRDPPIRTCMTRPREGHGRPGLGSVGG
jgi:hypothetical protein